MNTHFEASYPFYHDEYIWCVQKSQSNALWKRVFQLCLDQMVLALFTALSFSALLMGYILQKYENDLPKWDWMRLTLAGIACICGLPIEHSPKKLSSRLFLTFILFGCMIFGITFASFLHQSVLTNTFKHQVNSIREVVDNRFKLAGDEFAFQQLIKQNQVGSKMFFSLERN